MKVIKLILYLTIMIANNLFAQLHSLEFDKEKLIFISSDSIIEVENFSNETNYKLIECEFEYVNLDNSKIYQYYLIDTEGKFISLDLKLDKLNHKLWYYEIFESSIFVVINSLSFRDWITIKQFDITTGELKFKASGEIPCHKPFNFKVLDWQLGNEDCEWINFETSQISYRSNQIVDTLYIDNVKVYKSLNSIFSYKWETSEKNVLVNDLGPNFDAFTGGTLMNNIKFNKNTLKFEY